VQQLAHLLAILWRGDVKDGKADDLREIENTKSVEKELPRLRARDKHLFGAGKAEVTGEHGVAIEKAAINGGVGDAKLLAQEAGSVSGKL
jgi:hypothetical protein